MLLVAARNYYDILSVSKHANDQQIKRAYRKLALKYHPDKVTGTEAEKKEAARQFADINHAYETLSDPEKRKIYDNYGEEGLRQHAGQQAGGGKAERTTLNCADLHMDLLARKVTRAGRPLDLLPREFKLLEHLLRNKGRVVTRTMLLEQVWDYRFDPHTSLIDTHISRLRKKIDEGFDRPLLHTVRGAGYRLSEEP